MPKGLVGGRVRHLKEKNSQIILYFFLRAYLIKVNYWRRTIKSFRKRAIKKTQTKKVLKKSSTMFFTILKEKRPTKSQKNPKKIENFHNFVKGSDISQKNSLYIQLKAYCSIFFINFVFPGPPCGDFIIVLQWGTFCETMLKLDITLLLACHMLHYCSTTGWCK